jgi:hypothetical protein
MAANQEMDDKQFVMFLARVLRSIFYGVLILIVDIFFGMYLGWGMPEYAPTSYLVGFYTWFTLSKLGFIYFLYKTWRKNPQ